MYGSCYHSIGAFTLLNASNIATVQPSSFYSYGLWLVISGIYLNIAISKIVGLVSYYSDGIGNFWYLKSIIKFS